MILTEKVTWKIWIFASKIVILTKNRTIKNNLILTFFGAKIQIIMIWKSQQIINFWHENSNLQFCQFVWKLYFWTEYDIF